MGRKRPEHAKDFRGGAKNIPEAPLVWLPYQWRWIEDRATSKLMEKSRRTGISYGSAYEDARYHARRGSRLDTWVSSRDEPTAKLYAQDVATFSRGLNIGAVELGEQVMLDSEGRRVTAHTIPYANGTTLNSLASNPDVFAGKGGRVKLDEFALRKDPRSVYAIAGPSIDWGGALSIISTHRGSQNFFNLLIREIEEKGNPKGFSHHKVTLQDALDQHLLWKLQTVWPEDDPRMAMDEAAYFDYQRSRAADEESFLQEYMCIPADDAAAFISYALIDQCLYGAGERWGRELEEVLESGGEWYAGVDIGRHRDLTVMSVVEKVSGVFFLRKLIVLEKMPFSAQEAVLFPWMRAVGRTCIDETGLGMQFAERAQERFGKGKVEGVTFSGPTKEALAYPVRSLMEDSALKLPMDNKLHADLRKVRKSVTAAGNIRFEAEAGPEGHADRFWALALAIHAGSSAGVNLEAYLC